MNAQKFATKLHGAKLNGTQWTAFCPAHEDHEHPSLSFCDKGDKVLLKCFAGCTAEAIVSACGITLKDLFHDNDERERNTTRRTAEHTYEYRDENGELLYQVLRYRPKSFRQRQPDGPDRWKWNMSGVRRVPFRLLDLLASPDELAIFHEGEKAVEAAMTAGLPGIHTTTSGGAANWRMTDLSAIAGRNIVICPDNDAPGETYANGLAEYLIGIGATVKILRWPGVSEHGDSVEWLAAGGTPADFQKLCEVSSLFTCSDKPKQALERLLQPASQEPLEVLDLTGAFQVSFPNYSAVLHFQRLSENTRGVSAELTITVEQHELLGSTDLGLKSISSRDKLAKSLSESGKHVPWKRLLEIACAEVLKRHRHGEPFVELQPTDSTLVPFIVNPIVYRGHQTLIFAPGGSYKSYLALYVAIVVLAGLRQNGISAIQTNVLYLDWELDDKTVGARLKALHIGHPELAHVRPYYRSCTQPLHLEAPQIAAEVARRGVGLVIVDSAALACGGDLNSPESAIRLQQALRRIGCASIVLAHVSKSTAQGQDKSAYGTVFFRELARNVWELSRPENSNRVLLSQTGTACKNSFGRKQDPLGFEFSFESDQVRITTFNPADEEESVFEDKLPLRDRIRALLLDMRKRSAKEIAEGLHAPEGSVKVTLSSNRQLFTRSGPYHQGVWTLAASVKAPQGSLIPIVNAPIDNLSLRPLNGGKSMQPKELNSQDKQIVNNIVNNHYDPSLINGGVPIGDPSVTINDPIPVNDSQPEEVIDLL